MQISPPWEHSATVRWYARPAVTESFTFAVATHGTTTALVAVLVAKARRFGNTHYRPPSVNRTSTVGPVMWWNRCFGSAQSMTTRFSRYSCR